MISVILPGGLMLLILVEASNLLGNLPWHFGFRIKCKYQSLPGPEVWAAAAGLLLADLHGPGEIHKRSLAQETDRIR